MGVFYRGLHPVFMTPGRKRLRRVVIVMPVVISLYLFAFGDSGFYQIWHREGQIKALNAEIHVLKLENTRQQHEVVLLEDDLGEIERIAREQYGMVKTNESVYMIYSHLPEEGLKGAP